MIDPIHNQAYQEYTKVNRQKPQDVEQKFSMDSAMQEHPSFKENGVIYEPGTASKPDSDKAVSSDSVRTAQPHTAQTATDETASKAPAASTDSASFERFGTVIRRLFQNMLQGIKKVLTSIWESKPAENKDIVDPGTDIEEAAAETSFDPQTIDPVLDADIKKALKAKDTDSFRALLSQDGHRTPARNSSLLTYYDSRGNLVNLDPSEQYRILHGDRGSHKL